MRKSRLNKIENLIDDISPELEDKTRVEFWKEVLQGNRERPEYHKNVKRPDKICELLAREDLDLEIPEELEVALEREIESFQTALRAGPEGEAPDKEEIEAEVRDIARKTPANFNLGKLISRYRREKNE